MTNKTTSAIDLVTEGRRMFVLAAATLERDVLLHDLTEDEQNVLVGAVLNAAERHAADTITRLKAALTDAHAVLSDAQPPRRTEVERTVCINRALGIIGIALSSVGGE